MGRWLGFWIALAIAWGLSLAPASAFVPSDELRAILANASMVSQTCSDVLVVDFEECDSPKFGASSGAVEFTEPGSTTVSDYIFVCGGEIQLVSDGILPSCALNELFTNLGPETGDFVDITSDFTDPCILSTDNVCDSTQPAISNLLFESDVSDVPEPETWTVLLPLLLVFGFALKRIRPSSQAS